MDIVAGYNVLHIEYVQASDQSRHMVCIIVAADQIINLCHSLFFQIGHDESRCLFVTAVIDHRLSFRLYQNGQPLTHIQKMDFHLSCLRSRIVPGGLHRNFHSHACHRKYQEDRKQQG